MYTLIKTGLLPALKLGSYKIRKETLMRLYPDGEAGYKAFLKNKYEGYDLTNPLDLQYNDENGGQD